MANVIETLSHLGVVNIDCSGNGDGLTLDAIVLIISAQSERVRLDDVIISPSTVNGKLVLRIEINARCRNNVSDADALYLDLK